jgi:hypothetical protein
MLLLSAAQNPLPVKSIISLGYENGLRAIKKWNVSQILNELDEMVVRLKDGWEITEKGKETLSEEGYLKYKPTKQFQTDLRDYLSKISDKNISVFITETINALEYGLFRSAVVLSWVGAVYLLYDEVIKNHLVDFNAEAKRRNPNWKNAKSIDDLTTLKEYDFLQIICSISIIGKNLKQELESCLKLRNSCGHPNTFVIGENRVASHLEVLILNVYNNFAN